MLIHSDPNNMNSTVYHLIIERYWLKTLHWYFPWATALHLYNMTGRGEKLQQLHCYHQFPDSLDIYLTKNHYENYSPKMVPIAKIWGSGSWPIAYIYLSMYVNKNQSINLTAITILAFFPKMVYIIMPPVMSSSMALPCPRWCPACWPGLIAITLLQGDHIQLVPELIRDRIQY